MKRVILSLALLAFFSAGCDVVETPSGPTAQATRVAATPVPVTADAPMVPTEASSIGISIQTYHQGDVITRTVEGQIIHFRIDAIEDVGVTINQIGYWMLEDVTVIIKGREFAVMTVMTFDAVNKTVVLVNIDPARPVEPDENTPDPNSVVG